MLKQQQERSVASLDFPILSTQILPIAVWARVVALYFQCPFCLYVSSLVCKYSCLFDLLSQVMAFSASLALQLPLTWELHLETLVNASVSTLS